MYGWYGESSVNRSEGASFAPNGEFDDTCTKRTAPARRARSRVSCVPPTFTSNRLRILPSGWITPAAWNTVAGPMPSNSASSDVGSRTSPTTGSIDGTDDREQRRVGVVAHETSHAFTARGEGAHEVLSEPSRRAGDDGRRRHVCARK